MASNAETTDCALLISSCDAYSDLWRPFFTLLNRQWPDLPFETYLGTGHKVCGLPEVKTLHSEAGRDWSQCMIDYLDQIPHRHVLVMLDDFFLRGPVNTASVRCCLDFAQRHQAIQLRLLPRPGPTQRLPSNRLIGECEACSPYRLSTQAAIWDRLQLRALLHPGESIWEFEHQGNLRADRLAGGFYGVWQPVLPYQGFFSHHVIEKGRWLPHEKAIFARQNIGCDFSRRRTLSWGSTSFYHLAQITDRALDILPWRAKARCKRALKALLRPLFGSALDRLGQAPAQSRLRE